MINLKTKEYTNLITMMYATKHLINYINTDILESNTINEIDLKYLKARMSRVNELITKNENNEN